MCNVEQKLATSLSGMATVEIIPFLPCLLRDIFELGSSPDEIEALLRAHVPGARGACVLDLGCGKGAVAVRLARAFGCRVTGVDLLPAFIGEAKEAAEAAGVGALCDFRVEDINRTVENGSGYDITVLGAVGDVLGGPGQTLEKLKRTVRAGGHIVIDDAYSEEGAVGYPSRDAWHAEFEKGGLALVAEKPADPDTMRDVNRRNQASIERRAGELKKTHPEKADLFDGYVRSQQEECDAMEGPVIGVTWLLRKI